MAKRKITVSIDASPDSNTDIFRIGVADDILRLLADGHTTQYTIPELVAVTGAARSTVWRAVNLLEDVGAVQVEATPQRNLVSIDPDRLHKDDPILAIDQSEFHEPVRAFVEQVREAIAKTPDVTDVVGVVLFGSVARGEADRQSDIDLFVVVDGDRTSARRAITDVVSELREQPFDGDRFGFDPHVESTDSARRAGSKLHEIFTEGITVYGGDQFQSIRKDVFADE